MPKPLSGDIFVRELRITPPDQLPITDWLVNAQDFKMLLACQEGGDDTDKKLHYHCYIETYRSESWLKKWIYKIAHCYNGETGNSVFFSRAPHENTIGYVIKSGNVVVRHGCDQVFIDEWLVKSDNYKKSKETERKRDQRKRESKYKQIVERVQEELDNDNLGKTAGMIANRLIELYREYGIYPNKGLHETMVIKLVHPYEPSFVQAYYNRNMMFMNY